MFEARERLRRRSSRRRASAPCRRWSRARATSAATSRAARRGATSALLRDREAAEEEETHLVSAHLGGRVRDEVVRAGECDSCTGNRQRAVGVASKRHLETDVPSRMSCTRGRERLSRSGTRTRGRRTRRRTSFSLPQLAVPCPFFFEPESSGQVLGSADRSAQRRERGVRARGREGGGRTLGRDAVHRLLGLVLGAGPVAKSTKRVSGRSAALHRRCATHMMGRSCKVGPGLARLCRATRTASVRACALAEPRYRLDRELDAL